MTEDKIKEILDRFRRDYGKCDIRESNCSCCPPDYVMCMDSMLDMIETSLLFELDE